MKKILLLCICASSAGAAVIGGPISGGTGGSGGTTPAQVTNIVNAKVINSAAGTGVTIVTNSATLITISATSSGDFVPRSGTNMTGGLTNNSYLAGNGAGLTNLSQGSFTGTITNSIDSTNVTITGPFQFYNTSARTNGSYSYAGGQIHSNASGSVTLSGGTITATKDITDTQNGVSGVLSSNAVSIATIYPSASLNALGGTNLNVIGNQTNKGQMDVSGTITSSSIVKGSSVDVGSNARLTINVAAGELAMKKQSDNTFSLLAWGALQNPTQPALKAVGPDMLLTGAGGSGTTNSFFVVGAITATNGYWMPSNALSVWPTAPRQPGDAYWGNSNGTIYLLQSTSAGGTWATTNKIGQ